MVEIGKITTHLEYRKHGIWHSKKQSDISYPEDGNLRCFELEADSFWFKHRNKCVLEALRLIPPEGPIFDVGAGNGFVCLALKNAGFDTIVIEPGFQGAMNAYSNGLEPVICSTLEDAGFKPTTIPAVGLFDVLEHIEDDTGFLKTIKTLLIPEGILYITVPAYNFLWSGNDDNAGHYRRYTNHSLTTMLKSIGYKIELKTYIFSLLPISIFIFRTIPSKVYLNKHRTPKRSQKEHKQSRGLPGLLMDYAFGYELKTIRKKRTIPFGGSCLVVAKSS